LNETDGVLLLNDPVQLAELQAYAMERLASGRFTYNAPSGFHDDTVIATALAVHAIGKVWTADQLIGYVSVPRQRDPYDFGIVPGKYRPY
ncbi:MAG: hypothetical protein ABI947_28135, partial [Chloroflexota bacterium]